MTVTAHNGSQRFANIPQDPRDQTSGHKLVPLPVMLFQLIENSFPISGGDDDDDDIIVSARGFSFSFSFSVASSKQQKKNNTRSDVSQPRSEVRPVRTWSGASNNPRGKLNNLKSEIALI